MIIVPLIPFRRRRKGVPASMQPALALVAASYVANTSVRLTFDRAIDISAIVVAQISVNDADDLGLKYIGTGSATLDGPASVVVLLADNGDSTGSGTTLSAGAGNGIVAVDDGAAWAGVTGVELPFP